MPPASPKLHAPGRLGLLVIVAESERFARVEVRLRGGGKGSNAGDNVFSQDPHVLKRLRPIERHCLGNLTIPLNDRELFDLRERDYWLRQCLADILELLQ